MFWYLVICVLMMYPLSIRRAGSISGKKTQQLALLISCLILWFFMAFRHVSVGVDTQYYSYVFTQFPDIPFHKIFTAVTYATPNRTWAFDFEPGYRLLNKLVSLFSGSGQAITIVNSTLIIGLLYLLVRRESPNFLLSMWLYLTLGIYQTEMNVTRNAIAILIVYNAMPLARDRKFRQYALWCLLASTIHMAALVFIPVYWLFHNVKFTPKTALWAVLASCVVGVLFPVISPVITAITPDSLDKYFQGSNEELGSLVVGMFNGALFFMVCMMMRRQERRRVFEENPIGVTMLVLNLCFFGLNIGLADASRMAALFGPYLIVFLPQTLKMISFRNRKIDATAAVAVVSGVVYVLRMLVNNIGGTIPYLFFWQ